MQRKLVFPHFLTSAEVGLGGVSRLVPLQPDELGFLCVSITLSSLDRCFFPENME